QALPGKIAGLAAKALAGASKQLLLALRGGQQGAKQRAQCDAHGTDRQRLLRQHGVETLAGMVGAMAKCLTGVVHALAKVLACFAQVLARAAELLRGAFTRVLG